MSGEDTYALVEGEWDKFIFRKIQPQDWDRVVQHVQDCFMHDEPTCKLLGYNEQFGAEVANVVRKMLADDLSFLVEELETGELASVRITFRHKKETNFNDIEVTSREGKGLFKMVEEVENRADLFNRFDVDELAEFFVASTDPKFRQQGIVTEMYNRNLDFLRAEGFHLVKSIFTNPYTRSAATKLGFEEVARFDYTELTDEEGEPYFSEEDLTPDHFAAIMVKTL